MDTRNINLKGDDSYTVIGFKSISYSDILSLTSLYQPLIGKDGLCIYLTLYSESFSSIGDNLFNRLTSILNVSLNQLMQGIDLCEQYGLINTYIKNNNDKDNHFVFVLNHVKGCNEFIDDPIYSRSLLVTLGYDIYNQTVHKFDKPKLDLDKYKDITSKLDTSFLDESWNNYYDQDYHNSKINNYYNSDNSLKEFLNNCSEFVFPASLRNKENIALLQRVSDMYGLDDQQLRKALLSSIKDNHLDSNALLYYAANCSGNNTNNGYDMPCARFLQQLKQGVALSSDERKLLDSLIKNYHLSNEIINYILEFSLKKNKKISRYYVQGYANQLLYNKVTSLKDTIELLNNTNLNKTGKKAYQQDVPEYKDLHENEDIDSAEIENFFAEFKQ